MKYTCHNCANETPCELEAFNADFDPERCPWETGCADWHEAPPTHTKAYWMDRPTRIAVDVLNELERAKKVHPEFPGTIVEQVAIMAEEAGEAVREANRVAWKEGGTHIALRNELIQTAAMCLRVIENMK